MSLRIRRGGISAPEAPGPSPVYNFPTSTFTFPTLPDDGGDFMANGMINVKDYGAVGDGVADDTNAIQDALFASRDLISHAAMKKTVYFPNGTYLLTGLSGNTRGILQRRDNGQTGDTRWKGGMRLQGQTEAGVILRLADNAPDFQNAADPRFVIFQANYLLPEATPLPTTNHWGEDAIGLTAFWNIIRDMTIDLGSGNPGAVGICVQMHNLGAIRRVTVQDALGAGRTTNPATRAFAGLAEERQAPGPCHLHRITVKGCQYGFRLALAIHGQSIEHLRVEKQGTAGVQCDTNAIFIRGMTSSNSVPAVIMKSGESFHHFGEPAGVDNGPWVHNMTGVTSYDNTNPHLLLVDAVLTGTSGAATTSAIKNTSAGGKMYLRNIQTSGYARAAEEASSNITGTQIIEYATPPTHNLWGETITSGVSSTVSAVNITIKNTPERPWPVNMTSAVSLGVVLTTAASQTANMQTAIDNCPTDTMYFPSSRHGYVSLTSGTIIIRGNVRHILGNGIHMFVRPSQALTWQFGGPATGAPYFIDDVYIKHDAGATQSWFMPSQRDVVFLDSGNLGTLRNTAAGTGTVYLDNTTGQVISFDFAQDVFARQFNADGGFGVGKYVGGNLWILYYKSERGTRQVNGITGGNVELMGMVPCLIDEPSPSTPIWQFANANVSIEGSVYPDVWGGGLWANLVQETQGGVTRSLLRSGNTFTGDPAVRGANLSGDGKHVTLFRSKHV